MDIKFIDRVTGRVQIERPPAEGWLKWIYGNPLGRLSTHWLIRRRFLTERYARRMDRPSSCGDIEPFITRYAIDMAEASAPLEEYGSFNEFFSRKLKAEARPIGSGIISPGDGRLLAFEKIEHLADHFIKGDKFTLYRFLRSRSLADKYAGGSAMILRLAPHDYHRFHFPYAGMAGGYTAINGNYYSVSPYALRWNMARVFCENKRGFTQLLTDTVGDVLIAPIGATMVGSIGLSYTVGHRVEKGEEMGYFSFGGSSIALLFQAGCIAIDQDLLQYTAEGMESYIRMGECIARPID